MRDSSFVDHVLELLAPVGPARARAMMGGHMLYCRALPVALIADDRLYLKVDGETKRAFAEAGGEPFTYTQRGRQIEMSYWSPPDGALDDPESMQPWAELALAAAARARKPALPATAARARGRCAAPSRPRGRSRTRTRSRRAGRRGHPVD